MATDPIDPAPSARTAEPLTVWGRPLAIATAVVFLISSVFPVVAGLSNDTAAFPKWWGTLDVGIAFMLGLLALVMMTLAQAHVVQRAHDSTYHAYRILIHGIFVMIVVFFLAGDRIVWTRCLAGFAWRSWLFLYGLPA